MQNIYPLPDKPPQIDPSAWIAPTACIIGQVTLGADSSIWFNCVLRADINQIIIGTATNIQDGCLMHVTKDLGLSVGDRVTVGHGAILHGCKIDSDCLIGMGAIVLDGAQIGQYSLIAAGTIISPGTRIPPDSLVMGTPGKVVRQIRPGDRVLIDAGAQNYLGYKNSYSKLF
jgi:carbonic anhydrase/acetyltransferase-like protein (isoleucine patch superfamily)